ncbi:glutamine amidotransferase [soil metagenome]
MNAPSNQTGSSNQIGPSNQIGLLLCDHLPPDVVEAVADYPELYPAIFDQVGVDLRIYEVTEGDLPATTDECAGWIISGSKRSAYEDEGWINDVSDFIRTAAAARAPQVGICFGHQLIALALGGEVAKAPGGWGVGVKEFDVVSNAPWMTPPAEHFRMLMSHQDQVRRLPDGAELLATADYCPIASFRVEDHIFTVQGHPEFIPALSRKLIGKRREIFGADVADAALETLDQSIDHELVARWIASFFDN